MACWTFRSSLIAKPALFQACRKTWRLIQGCKFLLDFEIKPWDDKYVTGSHNRMMQKRQGADVLQQPQKTYTEARHIRAKIASWFRHVSLVGHCEGEPDMAGFFVRFYW